MTTPEQRQYRTSLEEVISNAKETLLRNGKHETTLIVEGSRNLVIGKLPDMPETQGNRREYMRFLGQLTAKSGRIGELRQVFLVSEGLLRAINKESSMDEPSIQSPNRKEVLIIGGIHIGANQKYLKIFELLRDSEMKIIGFTESLTDTIQDVSFDTPLEDAFVSGFQNAFKTRFN